MTDREPFALDAMPAAGRGVEQDVDKMVGQQIDLIDIENTTVGRREQTRLKGTFAAQGFLQMQGAEQPIFGGAQRQLDEREGPEDDGRIGGNGQSEISSPGRR